MSPVAQRMERAFQKTSTAADSLQKRLGGFAKNAALTTATGLGIGFGFGALARQIATANMELGHTQKSLAGALFAFQGWKAELTTMDRITHSMRQATAVTEELEKTEMRLAIPLTELGNVYRQVAGPAFTRLGMDQKQVLNLTNQAAAASKVFGVSGEQAAVTVTRALITGRVRGFDPFSNALRDMLGNTKKIAAPELYRRMQRGFADLAPAAEEMSKGLSGTMFRLQNFFVTTLRNIGAPTVTYIAQKLEVWRKHLSQVTADGRTLVQVYGDKLLSAFKTLEKITGGILSNWKAIAAVFVTSKFSDVAGSLSGFLGKGAPKGGSAAQMFLPGFGPALGGATGGLAAFASKLNIAAAAAVGLGLAIAAYVDHLGDQKVAEAERVAKMKTSGQAMLDALQTTTGAKGARTALAHAKSLGLMTGTTVNRTELKRMLSGSEMAEMRKDLAERQGYTGRVDASVLDRVVAATSVELERKASMLQFIGPSPSLAPGVGPNVTKAPQVGPFTGDIHITQDFKDQDPDRVFLTFKQGLEGLADAAQMSTVGSAVQGF